MMNQAYGQSSPPHDMHRVSLPNINDAYRPMPGAPQYGMPHPNPMAQHQQPTYDPYMNSRPPPMEPLHPEDSLATLAQGPGPQAQRPAVISKTLDGRNYKLVVVQQPQRARMCGFGDKDRRPITPPPCVQLIITDVSTGKEVDCNEIEHGMFVLNVDLWDEWGRHEVNLVRHSSSSPGISSTTPASFAEAPNNIYSQIAPQQQFKLEGQQQGYNPYPGAPQVNAYSNGQQYNNAPQYGYGQTNGASYAPQGYAQPPQTGYYPLPTQSPAPYGQQQLGYDNRQYPSADLTTHRGSLSAGQPQGMFTRNLIGSLAASAFRLTNIDDKIGICLRFSFVNVGVATSPSSGLSGKTVSSTTVNTGRAPVLASTFSDAFTVYSAKRFPGVVESTKLSRMFATQGIKIPIRKDGPGKGDKDKDDDGY